MGTPERRAAWSFSLLPFGALTSESRRQVFVTDYGPLHHDGPLGRDGMSSPSC
jgi:hypothetical protein